MTKKNPKNIKINLRKKRHDGNNISQKKKKTLATVHGHEAGGGRRDGAAVSCSVQDRIQPLLSLMHPQNVKSCRPSSPKQVRKEQGGKSTPMLRTDRAAKIVASAPAQRNYRTEYLFRVDRFRTQPMLGIGRSTSGQPSYHLSGSGSGIRPPWCILWRGEWVRGTKSTENRCRGTYHNSTCQKHHSLAHSMCMNCCSCARYWLL